MPFIANSDAERTEMLQEIGVASFDELIADIPEEIRLKRALDLFPAMGEPEVKRLLEKMASSNAWAVSRCWTFVLPSNHDSMDSWMRVPASAACLPVSLESATIRAM